MGKRANRVLVAIGAAVVYSVGTDLKDSWRAGEHAADALLSSRISGTADDLVYNIRASAE